MGMSTHIIGFIPPDDIWKKLKQVWDSCKAANINHPDEVDEFFNGEEPDDNGVSINLEDTFEVCCKAYHANASEGFEIDLSKVPKNVKIIRFYNSY